MQRPLATSTATFIDDDKFFVNCIAAMTVRQEGFDKNPKPAELLAPSRRCSRPRWYASSTRRSTSAANSRTASRSSS